MPPQLLDEFAARCRAALDRTFNEAPKEKFTIRMSNVGKPLCQLQMEQSGVKAEQPSYSHKMKMLIGDLHEAAAVVIMKAAGVPVEAENQKVSLDLGSMVLEGTYDVKIAGHIYDIKSASAYSFSHKFSEASGGFDALAKSDSFGYIGQGFGYAEADKSRFGGWIAIDKSTGEWAVVEVPDYKYEELKADALANIETAVSTLLSDAPFERKFADQEETYYKKATGCRTLGYECSWCSYKHTCWPGVQYKPQPSSKGQNPRWYYYTDLGGVRPNDAEHAEEV